MGKIEDPRDNNTYEASDVAGDCYTANLGFYYQLSPKLELSTGCSYTAFEYDDKELYYTTLGLYEALKNNNFNVGIGAGYKVTEKIQVDLAFARTFWKDYTINAIRAANPLMPNGLPVKTTDKGYVIAVGFDFSF
ncbi:MAG TPA: outer membrane protein transport protein [Tenuifilaceae bacterium]|nr:outer membrane protein transport protein [Tenuifilaceae bacterium]